MLSVCLASYNGAPWIEAQVLSVLAQLDAGDELIVSDNGSSDGTVQKLQALAASDSRLRLLHCDQRGVARNFQNALQHAAGDRIMLCDQDNLWLPGRVTQAHEGLADADLLVMDAAVVDAAGRLTAESLYDGLDWSPRLLSNLRRNGFVGCCMAFRRSLLALALPIPPRLPMHDWWLGLLATARLRTAFDPRPRMHFRRHQAAASTTGAPSARSLTEQVGERAYLVAQLALRLATTTSNR